MLDRGLREAKEGKGRNETMLLLTFCHFISLQLLVLHKTAYCATLIVWTNNHALGFTEKVIQGEKRHLLNKESAMTRVCVGCGTEVTDKEGRPVEKLYDQVSS